MSPVVLLVVAVDDVTKPRQFFRCLPYATKLAAGACIYRQASARAGVSDLRYAACRDCGMGRQIAAQCGDAGEADAKAMGVADRQRNVWRKAAKAGHRTIRAEGTWQSRRKAALAAEEGGGAIAENEPKAPKVERIPAVKKVGRGKHALWTQEAKDAHSVRMQAVYARVRAEAAAEGRTA